MQVSLSKGDCLTPGHANPTIKRVFSQPGVIRLRRLFSLLGVSAAGLLLVLLLLEAGVRIFAPQNPDFWDSSAIRRYQVAPPHFVENIPNARANYTGVPVSINSLGLRGDEVVIPKPAGTFRILGVGDSVTFGHGVRAEETFLKVLEQRLNESLAGKVHYEALNAASPGGGLADYDRFLRNKSAILQPDMVIVGLALNDILIYREGTKLSVAEAEWENTRLPLARKINRFFLRHSHLYMFCFSKFKGLLYQKGLLDINQLQGQNFLTLAPPSPLQAKAWASSFRMLSKIKAFCEEHKYRLVVVVFPLQMQLSTEQMQFYRDNYHLRLGTEALSGEPQKVLASFTETNGIEMIDLLPLFKDRSRELLYLKSEIIPSDPTHFSAAGHRVVADALLARLRIVSSNPTNALNPSTVKPVPLP